MEEIDQKGSKHLTSVSLYKDRKSSIFGGYVLASVVFFILGAISFGFYQQKVLVKPANDMYKNGYSPSTIPASSEKAVITSTTEPTENETVCVTNTKGFFTLIPLHNKECRLVFPLLGYNVSSYEFNYPENWSVRVAGAEGMNLVFNEKGKDKVWAIYLTTTKLPLSESYKATYGFELGPTTAYIQENEVIQSKKIENYGENQVLSLLTDENGIKRQKYFILKNNGDYSSVYVFDLKENSDPEFISAIQNVLTSFHTFDVSY